VEVARAGRTAGRSEGPGRHERTRLAHIGTLMALVATVVVVFCVLAPTPVAAQLHGQHWDVTPETARPTVGDTVTLAFRVRLDERDLLYDTVPAPALTPPDWIRIYSIDKLARQPDRIFIGHAKIAFYRPGRQAVPIFTLPFMRSVKGLTRGTLSSDSASVEVIPVLTAGASARLRDIKEPTPSRGVPSELVLGLAALLAAGWLAWRARSRAPAGPVEVVAPTAGQVPLSDPYQRTMERLAAIEAERWPGRDVARHYEAITDALRDYLAIAEGLPARERTSSELLVALPRHLSAGTLRDDWAEVLDAADLVKFARSRPDPDAAADFLGEARALLAGWRDAAPASHPAEVADAIR
jgi:hypothetical protein